MHTQIILTNKKWTRFKFQNISFYFIGYFEFKGTYIHNAKELEALIGNIKDVAEIKSYLEKDHLPFYNGNFAIIIKNNDDVLVISDYLRNFQILYLKTESGYIITDQVQEGFQKSLSINNENCEEFLLSGLVLGNDTVYHELKSLQPAEMLLIRKNSHTIINYYRYSSNPSRDRSTDDKQIIYKQMDELFLTMFKRMVKSCPNVRNWVIPLSGGHDSRLIINYLYRLGYKNVICFTYGVNRSKEVEISKDTALALGYKWYFIDYSIEQDWVDLHQSGLFDKYIHYAFNGCNLPHVQDLLALKILKDKGVINEQDVVVPGHTAFTESESEEILNLESVKRSVDYVYSKYYILFKGKNQNRFKKRLDSLLKDKQLTPNTFPDFFNWSERQVKFIGNSVRAYEFFGMEWRMPFWEKDIIDFWNKLDYYDRIERKILISASKELLFIKELSEVPIINKFEEPKEKVNWIIGLIPLKLKSYLAAVLNYKSNVPVGTNMTFISKGSNIQKILEPVTVYPKSIHQYIKPYLVRKPFQMNVNALMIFYLLKKEVYQINK